MKAPWRNPDIGQAVLGIDPRLRFGVGRRFFFGSTTGARSGIDRWRRLPGRSGTRRGRWATSNKRRPRAQSAERLRPATECAGAARGRFRHGRFGGSGDRGSRLLRSGAPGWRVCSLPVRRATDSGKESSRISAAARRSINGRARSGLFAERVPDLGQDVGRLHRGGAHDALTIAARLPHGRENGGRVSAAGPDIAGGHPAAVSGGSRAAQIWSAADLSAEE